MNDASVGVCAVERCSNPSAGGRLCRECEDAMIDASAAVRVRKEMRTRPLTVIERMIDEATGHATPNSGSTHPQKAGQK